MAQLKKLSTRRYLVTFRAMTTHDRACTHFETLLTNFCKDVSNFTGRDWVATVKDLDKKENVT